jgi:hypothetical protein
MAANDDTVPEVIDEFHIAVRDAEYKVYQLMQKLMGAKAADHKNEMRRAVGSIINAAIIGAKLDRRVNDDGLDGLADQEP